MGRVSKRKINVELQKELDEQLNTLIVSFSGKDEIHQFLGEFLTQEERTMLGKRLVLYMMLQKGFRSSEIQNSLSISLETVRSHKYLLENKRAPFIRKIQKLIKLEKNRQFWKKIEKAFEPLDLALRSKTDMRARAKFLQGAFDE
ncbi:MAG: hypothetical protein HYV40_00210 [Candidatus Levybacteria bacterium]|nr:hypothetical protein [Candidatus Levybacteria bacterium]